MGKFESKPGHKHMNVKVSPSEKLKPYKKSVDQHTTKKVPKGMNIKVATKKLPKIKIKSLNAGMDKMGATNKMKYKKGTMMV